jgi:ribonucleoside-triphosphate reductase
MTEAKLDPVRDAGKFVYHLKTLRKAGLVTVEKGTKKYSITELGGRLVEFSRDLEEFAATKKGRLFVRTSRMTIDEFDRTRIARSLVTEAGMPQTLANEIASEAEERLLRFGTAYITSPLIRELVNSILVERKLEEYRHKLTRLGLPVNDVTSLIREAGQKHLDSGWVERSSGSAVTEEYVLLAGLTKPLADAHLSGRIHLEETDSWLLKPSQFFHDPRPFLEKGMPGSEAPSTLESAIGTLEKLFRTCEGQVSGEQVLDHANYFLAPFIKGIPDERVEDAVRLFLFKLNWDGFTNNIPSKVTIGIDRDLPPHLRGQPAMGPGGKREGIYDDLSREANELFRIIIDSATETSRKTGLVNPSIIIKLSKTRLSEPDELIRKAYESSAKYSIPNYLLQEPNHGSTVSSEGCVFQSDGEKESLSRGPILGSALVNIPRVAYEAMGKDEKFLEGVHEGVLDAVRALELRRGAVEERMKDGLLPLLSWHPDGQAYYGSHGVTAEIGLMGLAEAVKHHAHSDLGEKQTMILVRRVFDTVKKATEESETPKLRIRVGLHPSPEASARLASIDAEKFGFSTLVYQGSKKYPYYTDVPAMPFGQKIPLSTRINVEGEIQKLLDGGSMLPLRIGTDADSEIVGRATRQVAQAGVKYFTYTSMVSVCQQCHHPHNGIRTRCENCGSDHLTVLGRYSGRRVPVDMWPEARRKDLEKLAASDLN